MKRSPSSRPSLVRAASLVVLSLAAFSCNTSFDKPEIAFNVTVRVSVKNSGAEGHGDALNGDRVAISGDGRYVAFASDAVDLVSNDTNLKTDVFVRDTVGGGTVLASVSIFANVSANGRSTSPTISDDGQYVCFESTADDLDPDDPDAISDIFVRDLVNSTTTLISRASGTGVPSEKGDGDSTYGSISANGRYVVFESLAENLDGVSGGGVDDDAVMDVYRRDFLDPTLVFKTILVSWASDGDPNIAVPTGSKGLSGGIPQNNELPRVSGDGRWVVWQSFNSNLAQLIDENGPDANGTRDIFARDLSIPKTYRISVGTISIAGTNPPDANGLSESPAISADGSVVTYHTSAYNIVPEDSDQFSDIYYYNLTTQVSKIATIHTSGSQAGAGCNYPAISGTGRYVVFQSPSINLVNGDSNSAEDCFMHDTLTHVTSRISVRTFGGEANGKSLHPAISGDGRYVAFWSEATNMVDEDSNGSTDVFMRGPPR